MSDRHNPSISMIDNKVCPYCIEKTKVVSRWMGIPTLRKCKLCGRSWNTGW